MKYNRKDDEYREIVSEYKRVAAENPGISNKDAAAAVGVSIAKLYRARTRFPEDDHNVPADLIETITDEFNNHIGGEDFEVVKCYVYSDSMGSYFNAVPVTVKIPAGFEGKKRKIILHAAVFKGLHIIEE